MARSQSSVEFEALRAEFNALSKAEQAAVIESAIVMRYRYEQQQQQALSGVLEVAVPSSTMRMGGRKGGLSARLGR